MAVVQVGRRAKGYEELAAVGAGAGVGHAQDAGAVVAQVGGALVLELVAGAAGAGAVGYLIESMHGAGPPTAQRIMVRRQAQIEEKIDQVKAFLSIK